MADFNGDGKPDLDLGIASRTIYGYTTNALLVLLGNGDGTFTATPDVPVVGFVTSILVADLNGDRRLRRLMLPASQWEISTVTVFQIWR